MREKRWYVPVYMFIVTAAFSSVVIGFAMKTENLVEVNAQAALEKAVLQVLPTLYSETASRSELHKTFVEQVGRPSDETGGAYVFKKGKQIEAYAVPFSGQGFWATIKGVVGVKADKKTITGIAFYEQSETPGLGAEITKPTFKNQFPGRILADKAVLLKMKRPGESLAQNEYHAITGATQTSTRVEKIINDALNQWQEKIEKRGGQK